MGQTPACCSGLSLPYLTAKVFGFLSSLLLSRILLPLQCCAAGAAVVVNLCIFSGMSLSFQLPVVKPTGVADASACTGTECTENTVLKDVALCTTVADVRGWKRSCFLRKSLFLMCIREREAKKCVLLNLS